jgi:hypothetical protein
MVTQEVEYLHKSPTHRVNRKRGHRMARGSRPKWTRIFSEKLTISHIERRKLCRRSAISNPCEWSSRSLRTFTP